VFQNVREIIVEYESIAVGFLIDRIKVTITFDEEDMLPVPKIQLTAEAGLSASSASSMARLRYNGFGQCFCQWDGGTH